MGATYVEAPRRTNAETRWRGHPVLSALVRVAIALLPLLTSFVAIRIAGRLTHPQGHRLAWLAGYVALGLLVAVATQRLARRFLPLAAVLKLTMLFPDQAPSRFRVARGASSTRRLEERVSVGADDTEVSAAEKILVLVSALAAHDKRTRGHAERVRAYTDLLAQQLKLPRAARDRLRWSALLHDIGKLGVAADILNKLGKPDDDEWAQLRRHPSLGAELAAPLLPWLGEWGHAIEEHHERFDGHGYPHGLVGAQTSLGGRLVCLVDAFEVMTAARSYKPAVATRTARAELTRCAGSQFDPHLVRAFLEISLPRLLWAMGPLSFLLQIPFLRDLQQVGGQMGSQVAAGTAAAAVAGVTGIAAAGVVPIAHIATHKHDRTAVSAAAPHGHPHVTTTPRPSRPRAPKAVKPNAPAVPAGQAAPAPTSAYSPTSNPTPAPTEPTRAPTEPTPTPTEPTPTPSPTDPPPPADTSPPAMTVTAKPPATSNSDTATVEFDSDDPTATYECQLDGGAWTACTSPYTASGLTEGPHNIQVRGTDPAGNVGDPASVNFTVDTGAPTTTLRSTPDPLISTDTATVDFTSDDLTATYECRLDGVGWAGCTTPMTYSGLSDGDHRIEVRGISATNQVGAAVAVDFTVDTRAPAARFTSRPPDPTASSTVTVDFTSDGARASFECRLDSGSWRSCSRQRTYGGLADGSHTIAVRATDRAGNTGAPVSTSFVVASAAPTIDRVTYSGLFDRKAKVTFTVAPGLTAECRLNNRAWASCQSPVTYDLSIFRSPLFQVRGVDSQGNYTATASRRL